MEQPRSDSDGLTIRVLGPVQVTGPAGAAHLGGSLQGGLLGLLALRAGSVVRPARLIDGLWGEEPPRTARRTLQSHVCRLRRVLDACGLPGTLVSEEAGYRLAVPAGMVDALRFGAAMDAADDDRAEGSAAGRVARLRDALALWRGDPLQGQALADWAVGEVTRLREMRAGALEALWTEEVRGGAYGPAVAELERLVDAYPLRERLWELLMVALDRSGRRADALAAYQRARQTLIDELGIEPGPQLRRRQAAILTETTTGTAPPAGEGVAGLPTPFTSLVGRAAAVEEVTRLLAHRRLVTLTGFGGSGKSRLAIEAAARAGTRVAEGVTYVDMAVTGTGDDAMAAGLRSARRLVVLDNCARLDEAAVLVQRLLAECPGLRVLVTAREPLRVPGETVYRVAELAVPDPSVPQTLAELSAYPAVRLFCDRMRERTGRPVPPEHAAAVAAVCAGLDGLPLALELAAGRTGVLSVPEIAGRLPDRFWLLRSSDRAVPARHRSLRAVVDAGYAALDDAGRALLRCLSARAGAFGLETVEALWGDRRPGALDVLEALVAGSMVLAEPGPDGTLYRLPETVRQYAAAETYDRQLVSAVSA